MPRNRSVRTAVLLTAAAATWCVGAAVPAQAGVAFVDSSLVVDTQFWEAPSDVISATGLLAGCTTVVDLGQAPTRAPSFNGRKLVQCGDGSFVLSYQARPWGDGVTGTWSASAGTGSLAGLRGAGSLSGSTDCVVQPGSYGCIEDTWTGELFIAPPA